MMEKLKRNLSGELRGIILGCLGIGALLKVGIFEGVWESMLVEKLSLGNY